MLLIYRSLLSNEAEVSMSAVFFSFFFFFSGPRGI